MATRDPRPAPGPEYPRGTGAGMARERAIESERSTADILKEIVDHAQEIIRSEIRLARVEIREEISKAVKAAGAIGAGAVIALFGAGFVFAAITWALALAMPAWAAALIVGVVLAIVGLGLISAGRKKFKNVKPAPERTVQSLKEDAEWLKQQARR